MKRVSIVALFGLMLWGGWFESACARSPHKPRRILGVGIFGGLGFGRIDAGSQYRSTKEELFNIKGGLLGRWPGFEWRIYISQRASIDVQTMLGNMIYELANSIGKPIIFFLPMMAGFYYTHRFSLMDNRVNLTLSFGGELEFDWFLALGFSLKIGLNPSIRLGLEMLLSRHVSLEIRVRPILFLGMTMITAIGGGADSPYIGVGGITEIALFFDL